MNKVDKLAWILILLYILSKLAEYSSSFLISGYAHPQWIAENRAMLVAIPLIENALLIVTKIAIAIWLYHKANIKGEGKWVWACLGLFYGLIAVVLYVTLHLPRDRSASQE